MSEHAPASPLRSTPKPAASIEVDEEIKEDEIKEDEAGEGAGGLSRELYKEMRATCDAISGHRISIRGDEDYYPAALFRRIPNKRNLPEYHTIIQEPRAISTLKSKIQTRKYTSFAEYVRDFALIVHNAQVFNRPNSGPVKDVLVLKSIFEEDLRRLVEQGLITKEDTKFPDLGEIPDATPEPDLLTEDEEEGEDVDGEDEDEDDEPDDSDEDGRGKRSRRRGGRASMAGRKRERSEEGQKGGDGDARKRRGRPPRVDTPMEARIKAVLKSIRKFRNDAGHLKVLAFERLPDKTQNPGYYLEIKEPIAVDLIKRKVKRKKYQSLEYFMKDMEVMFTNAMQYNEDESDIYKDAKELWEEAQKTAEAEKQKPDNEYLMEDGRLPLPNGILHNGELWKVGDWAHIQNPNDVTKPIVAQLYRTWQDNEGQQWVNACWYYRPEQTVHQYEKHFYPNEVVKTGQYRDHHIDEIVDRCFVMFFTRYNRGRPRGLDPSKEVYVCEARYNEEKHRLNKIKTWASCLPDEVREKDYEMDLFDTPKKIKKIPSPLKHLLKDDAKETDELPSPQWGRENAPPIAGAVHRQPRDENQSPPPAPTPPPPPTPPPAPPRQLSNTVLPRPISRPSIDAHGDSVMSDAHRRPSSTAHPVPQMMPGSAYHQASASPLPGLGRPTPYQPSHPTYASSGSAQTPSQPQTYTQPTQITPSAAHPSSYSTPATSTGQAFASRVPQPNQHVLNTAQTYQPPASASASVSTSAAASTYPTHQPAQRHPDVYVMSEAANASIPLSIRQQFPCDDQGRVLWFTTPPLNNTTGRAAVVSGRDGKVLAHSPAYLAKREEKLKLVEERGKEREQEKEVERKREKDKENRTMTSEGGEVTELNGDAKRRRITDAQVDALLVQNLTDKILDTNKAWYQARYGDRAAEVEAFDAQRSQERMAEVEEKKRHFEGKKRDVEQRREREARLDGRVFKDDWDERY